MRRSRSLEEILRLDPLRDHQRIMFLVAAHEFPFDLPRSLEFALFRTFAVPSISRLLARTGEFSRRPQKRYDDTDLLLSTIYEHGYDSEPGRAALRRINQIHRRFDISNDDYLYVLSTFVFEPIRWMKRFGARPMLRQEELAAFHFWREVGKRMNIHGIPQELAELERFNLEYERTHFRFTEANREIGTATRDLFLGWVLPRPLFALGEPVVHALMDDRLLEAFGFPRPNPLLRSAVERALRVRSRLAAWLPARRGPRLRTQLRRPPYPDGYTVSDLGPRE